MTKAQAGAIGGTATFNKYGSDEMVRRGKLGGRPRLLTLSEIRHQQALDANKKLKEELRGKRYRANKKVGAAA
jgi:hypothetical protein